MDIMFEVENLLEEEDILKAITKEIWRGLWNEIFPDMVYIPS